MSLGQLALHAGLSKYKLHRLFKAHTGYTPAQYVQQVRVHAAAMALLLERSSVLKVAVRYGYHSHETFTRAFQRVFGCSPKQFRHAQTLVAQQPPPAREGAAPFAVSATRLQPLPLMTFAAVRHLGAYDRVPAGLWRKISSALNRRRIAWHGLLGVGYDNPQSPPTGGCRFDAGVLVRQPFEPFAGITCRQLPPTDYAVTTHVGGYLTLSQALPLIFQQSRELPGYQVQGLPLLEVYQSPVVVAGDISHTDIYVPLLRLE